MNRRIALTISFIAPSLMACCCAAIFENMNKQADAEAARRAEMQKTVIEQGDRQGVKFTAERGRNAEGLRLVDLVFASDPEDALFVDNKLFELVKAESEKDGTSDILGMAFIGDRAMNERQYGGAISYRASAKRIEATFTKK